MERDRGTEAPRVRAVCLQSAVCACAVCGEPREARDSGKKILRYTSSLVPLNTRDIRLYAFPEAEPGSQWGGTGTWHSAHTLGPGRVDCFSRTCKSRFLSSPPAFTKLQDPEGRVKLTGRPPHATGTRTPSCSCRCTHTHDATGKKSPEVHTNRPVTSKSYLLLSACGPTLP